MSMTSEHLFGYTRGNGGGGEVAARYAAISPYLDERQRRLWVGAGARVMGKGGISLVARATRTSRPTIYRAMAELEAPPVLDGRVRRPGGGRKRLVDHDPGLAAALDALVDPDSRGDPMSPLRWTCKSTGQLALALTRAGHPVSDTVVGEMLRASGYSLQANAKVREGGQNPDRNAQFHYLNEQAREFRDAGFPVVSVDAKKKELVGEYKNARRQGGAEAGDVGVHDAPETICRPIADATGTVRGEGDERVDDPLAVRLQARKGAGERVSHVDRGVRD
jgi:hypothetical protein